VVAREERERRRQDELVNPRVKERLKREAGLRQARQQEEQQHRQQRDFLHHGVRHQLRHDSAQVSPTRAKINNEKEARRHGRGAGWGERDGHGGRAPYKYIAKGWSSCGHGSNPRGEGDQEWFPELVNPREGDDQKGFPEFVRY
jgi:hypothetical protein